MLVSSKVLNFDFRSSLILDYMCKSYLSLSPFLLSNMKSSICSSSSFFCIVIVDISLSNSLHLNLDLVNSCIVFLLFLSSWLRLLTSSFNNLMLSFWSDMIPPKLLSNYSILCSYYLIKTVSFFNFSFSIFNTFTMLEILSKFLWIAQILSFLFSNSLSYDMTLSSKIVT